jgi:hypothetical protein
MMYATRRQLCLGGVAVALVVSGCSSAHLSSKTPAAGATPRSTVFNPTKTGNAPPDVVDGIPLRRLAEVVRTPAANWSEPHPFNIRVAVGNDRAADALMGANGDTYDYGDTVRAYVVALDGHFSCNPPKCVGSEVGPVGPSAGVTQPTIATSTTSVVPISTMLLTFNSKTLLEDGSFRVVSHAVDMTRLGRVYSLDGYR